MRMLDNHFEVRYKLSKKSEIQESGGLAPRILSISCKVVDVGCRCKSLKLYVSGCAMSWGMRGSKHHFLFAPTM